MRNKRNEKKGKGQHGDGRKAIVHYSIKYMVTLTLPRKSMFRSRTAREASDSEAKKTRKRLQVGKRE